MENEIDVKTEPVSLIALAIQKGTDIDQLSKLMDLDERWRAGIAKRNFLAALTEFQRECPQIYKAKEVNFGNTKYRFAPLADITEKIKDAMHSNGLSFRWEIQDLDKKIRVTCKVSHRDGHTEETSMEGGYDSSGSKNDIQQRGSTITYLRRYTLVGALGISTDDSDTDSSEVKKPNPEGQGNQLTEDASRKIMEDIKKECKALKTSIEIKESVADWVSAAQKKGIWPTHLAEMQKFIRGEFESRKNKKEAVA